MVLLRPQHEDINYMCIIYDDTHSFSGASLSLCLFVKQYERKSKYLSIED